MLKNRAGRALLTWNELQGGLNAVNAEALEEHDRKRGPSHRRGCRCLGNIPASPSWMVLSRCNLKTRLKIQTVCLHGDMLGVFSALFFLQKFCPSG